MTKPIDPYSRVYWRVLEDERFEDIRGDMRHFGSWALMLMVADMAYPAPAFIPPTVSRASLAKLADCGLIEPLKGGLFRVHGLEAERSRRAGGGLDGSPRGTGREPERTPAGAEPEPLARALAKPSQDETRKAEPSPEPATPDKLDGAGETEDALDVYWRLGGSYPSGKAKEWIEQLAAEFGDTATGNAIAAETVSGPRGTILQRAQNRLRSEAHKAEKDRAAKAIERVAPKHETREEREAREVRRRAVLEEASRMKVVSA